MKHFADPRPRDGQGQFAGADTGGLDPSSMNVAYDPNIIAARKRVLSQKAIAEVGRLKDEGGSGAELSMKTIKTRIKELARGERIAKLAGFKPIHIARGREPGVGFVGTRWGRMARDVRKIDQIKGASLKSSMQPKRDAVIKDLRGEAREVISKRKAALREDSETIQGSLGSSGFRSPLARKTAEVRKAYGLSSIAGRIKELAGRLDAAGLRLWFAKRKGDPLAVIDARRDVRRTLRRGSESSPTGKGNKAWKRADQVEKAWRASGGFAVSDFI
jgi:hypothetical protein